MSRIVGHFTILLVYFYKKIKYYWYLYYKNIYNFYTVIVYCFLARTLIIPTTPYQWIWKNVSLTHSYRLNSKIFFTSTLIPSLNNVNTLAPSLMMTREVMLGQLLNNSARPVRLSSLAPTSDTIFRRFPTRPHAMLITPRPIFFIFLANRPVFPRNATVLTTHRNRFVVNELYYCATETFSIDSRVSWSDYGKVGIFSTG